jgi:GTPase
MPPPSLSVRRSGTAAIIGRSNVGKSTLLNAALRQALAIVTPTPQTTRDRILGVVRHGDAQIALLDTPGLHKAKSRLGKRMNAAARHALQGADVMIFMAQVPKGQEAPQPHPGDLTLLKDLGMQTPTVLVINKVDQWKDKSKLLPLLQSWQAVREFAAIVPISARRTDGVESVLDEVAKLLPERGAPYDEDFLTDRPLRFFAAEYVREQVIRSTSQEVPHSVAVSIERYDEMGTVVQIEATIHCARSGQRAILIGTKGQRMKEIGIAARKRIEALLERQVNLKLWVKVSEGWADSPQSMEEIGYDPEAVGERGIAEPGAGNDSDDDDSLGRDS